MRFAQHRISPTKAQGCNRCVQHSPSHTRLLSQRTYIHYNNAIYMGGLNSYKRNGHGLLLLDDGSSLLAEHSHDSMTGHNVVFRENCIISAIFLKNGNAELAVRTGQCLIKLPFPEKEELATGNGLLIDYQTLKVYHLLFQNGKIVRKIAETNRAVLEKVMAQQLHAVMDQRHEDAFKFRLKPSNGIKVLKEGKRIVVGFLDQRHHLEGVGVKLRVNEDYDDLAAPLELKCFERGFYLRNRLQNYGERYFSNGNLYMGEFEDDLFNGQGLLLYPHEEKWVQGVFEGEKLKKLTATNLDAPDRHSIRGCLREIHELNTKNWINADIAVFDWERLKQLLADTFTAKITDVVVEKERAQREEQERLGRIQEHFSSETPGSHVDRLLEEQITKTKCNVEKVVLEEYGSLKTKVLEIQPRNTENLEYWSSATPTYRPSPHKILTPSHSNWKVQEASSGWKVQEASSGWKVQDSRQAQAKLLSTALRTSPSRATHSPHKRFHYPTNA